MARIALLGTGKTGGKVLEIPSSHTISAFDEYNQPDIKKLKSHDAAISFLPGPILKGYIPMLIEAGIPLASGSTGIQWPDDIDKRLKAHGLTWITASNFAIGMNLIHGMIKVLSHAPEIFDEYSFVLHEIHHKDKQDSPSGTALTWQQWLGRDVKFEDERIGDTVGDHRLTLETEYETINLQHIAKDRKIFARGALWTAERLIKGGLDSGLLHLSDVMKDEIGI